MLLSGLGIAFSIILNCYDLSNKNALNNLFHADDGFYSENSEDTEYIDRFYNELNSSFDALAKKEFIDY